jgi:hypothetical protein
MDHDTITNDWRQNAASNDEENYHFLRSLKFRRFGFSPDKLAADLHEQAFQIVQCSRCANCCKTMDVTLNAKDIARIANHLGMSVEDFIATHLEQDEEDHSYKTRRKPCPFLGDDDRCTIYEVRPNVCREFPHTDKKGFTTRTMLHASNALTCPAVFWIVEQMKHRAHRPTAPTDPVRTNRRKSLAARETCSGCPCRERIQAIIRRRLSCLGTLLVHNCGKQDLNLHGISTTRPST